MEQFLKLKAWYVISICIVLCSAFSANVYRVNAQQDKVIEVKASNLRVSNIEDRQEKINDKNDKKFERVISQMSVMNLRLERIATKLEERTQ